MPIRDRLRRLRDWAASLLVPAAPRRPAPSTPVTASPPVSPAPPASTAGHGGHVVVSGEVSVRLWTVGGLVVLATGPAEAERALAGLVGHADPTVRHEADRLLATLRAGRAAAA